MSKNENTVINHIPKRVMTNIYTPQYITDINQSIETGHINDNHNISINKNIDNKIPFDEVVVYKETKNDGTNELFGDNDDDDCEVFVPVFSSKSEVNIIYSNSI